MLLLAERIDEWVMGYVESFEGKRFKDATRGDLELGGLASDADREQRDAELKESKGLLKRIKDALGERVTEVRVSERLKESPACLVRGEHDLTEQMRRILAAAGQQAPAARPVLEVNVAHPLVKYLEGLSDTAQFTELAQLMYDQAALAEGAPWLTRPSTCSASTACWCAWRRRRRRRESRRADCTLAGPGRGPGDAHRDARAPWRGSRRRCAPSGWCATRIRSTAARSTTRWCGRWRARSSRCGAPTIRFNFRGVGASGGSYDEGRGETEDTLAVIAHGRQRWPQAALWLAGFSFGGVVAMQAAARGAARAAWSRWRPASRASRSIRPRPGLSMAHRAGWCRRRRTAGRGDRLGAHALAVAAAHGAARSRALLPRPHQRAARTVLAFMRAALGRALNKKARLR